MLRKHKNKTEKKTKALLNFVKFIFSIVILTALVLGISYFIKGASTLTVGQVMLFSEPILQKLGINTIKISQVAGDMTQRVQKQVQKVDTGLTGGSDDKQSSKSNTSVTPVRNDVLYNVSIMGDSHDDTVLLAQALQKAKDLKSLAVFHLGDLTNLGVIENLETAKDVLDRSGMKYYVIPGDHDLWKSVGPDNFKSIFGKNYQSVKINDTKFVMLDNSANYTVIDNTEMTWFKTEVLDANFVLLAQPLYHPTFDVVMGIVNGEEVKTVKDQADEILKIIRDSKVKAIIAADQHMSSDNVDPIRSDLHHIVVGAITKDKNLQTNPRFSVLEFYKDGGYGVRDVMLE
jgi:predicted phosphodiesterase